MLTNIIRKIADYVLLNAYSVNSSSFYNGKAGMSLSLFEVSRLLQDEYLEEHAFELLQEALLSKSEDAGFSNGLAGIGFVFHYLIDNHFVEADFDEIFGDKKPKSMACMQREIQSWNSPISPMAACIDRLYLLRRDEERNKEEIELLEAHLFSDDERELEVKLGKVLLGPETKVGYENGIVRWLIYVVFLEFKSRGSDVSRFDKLFKLLPVWKR